MHLTTKRVFYNETGVLRPIVRFVTQPAFRDQTCVLHILDIHRYTWQLRFKSKLPGAHTLHMVSECIHVIPYHLMSVR